MAGQIELAHSKDIVGAGIVAGGPFACAETASSELFPYWPIVVWQNATQAANSCMKDDWGAPDADKLAKRAKELAEDGKIDDLSGLADDKVYLFSGNEDQTVVRSVVEAAKRFYEAAGVPAGSVTLVEKEGGHAFLTETEGTACGLSKDPYVSDCDYDQAKAILEWIYGVPLVRSVSPSPTGKFITFDQSPFNNGVPNGLAAEGVVYVPEDCVSHSRLPLAHRAAWLRPGARDRRRRLHREERLCPLRRHQPARRPVPADRRECDEPAWLLGLVGL